jgi:hypothetical protein
MSKLFYNCLLTRGKCKLAPCPVCHNRGACPHCADGQRKHGCKNLETTQVGPPDVARKQRILDDPKLHEIATKEVGDYFRKIGKRRGDTSLYDGGGDR